MTTPLNWESTLTRERAASVTHITLPANSVLGEIYSIQHRMPTIHEKADREAWLTGTPEGSVGDADALPGRPDGGMAD